MKIKKNNFPKDTKLHDVAIHDLDVSFVASLRWKIFMNTFIFAEKNAEMVPAVLPEKCLPCVPIINI